MARCQFIRERKKAVQAQKVAEGRYGSVQYAARRWEELKADPAVIGWDVWAAEREAVRRQRFAAAEYAHARRCRRLYLHLRAGRSWLSSYDLPTEDTE